MADHASPAAEMADLPKPHRFTWDEVVRLSAADVFGATTWVAGLSIVAVLPLISLRFGATHGSFRF